MVMKKDLKPVEILSNFVPNMKKYIAILLSVMVLVSCKTEFEKVKMSQNPKRIYKAALQYYNDGDYAKAESLFALSIPNYRGKKEAEELYFKYAYSLYHQEQYIMASHYFNSFAKTFYNSKDREEAVFMSAYSNYMMSPKASLEQTYTQKAIENFQTFVNTYPRSERVAECNKLIDEMRLKLEEKAYEQGALYFKLGRYQAALHSFESMLKDFPDTKRAENIRYMMVKTSYEYATRSIYDRKKERFQNTIDLYNRFKKKYDKSQYNKELQSYLNKSKSEIKKLK